MWKGASWRTIIATLYHLNYHSIESEITRREGSLGGSLQSELFRCTSLHISRLPISCSNPTGRRAAGWQDDRSNRANRIGNRRPTGNRNFQFGKEIFILEGSRQKNRLGCRRRRRRRHSPNYADLWGKVNLKGGGEASSSEVDRLFALSNSGANSLVWVRIKDQLGAATRPLWKGLPVIGKYLLSLSRDSFVRWPGRRTKSTSHSFQWDWKSKKVEGDED